MTPVSGGTECGCGRDTDNNHWARLSLVGTKSPRDGQGAVVKLVAGGRTQWRQVGSAHSYLSASELPVTFGLGAATSVDSVEITWPDGSRQTVSGVTPGKLFIVEQGK